MIAPAGAGWRPSHGQAVAGVFAIGLLLRLAIAPYGGHHFDVPTFQFWTFHLVLDPLSEFYHLRQQFLPEQDHLPGDLWFLWLIGQVFRIFSPEMDVETPGFVWLLKLVPALADLGVAWVLYRLGSLLWHRSAGLLAAVFVLFNPGAVFLTSVWGQWDALSTFFALLALWLYLTGRLGWVLPALTYATLIKPQFAALFPLIAVAYYLDFVRRAPGDEEARREGYWGDILTPVAAGAVISAALVAIVCLPFGVGLFGLGEWSIVERMRIAVDMNKFASLYAFNLWTAIRPPTTEWQVDTVPFLLGASYQAWGTALTAVAYLAVLVAYMRDRRPLTLLWAAMTIMLVLYILPTRIHERYMLPVVLMCALPAAADQTYRRLFAVLTVTYFVNIWFVYTLQDPPRVFASASRSAVFYVAFSLTNVAVLAAMLWQRPLARRSGDAVEDLEASDQARPSELSAAPPPA
ncbi:MAG: hypothetical protein AB7I38_02200 [Dehalococcoidia bacterium]